MEMTSTTSTSNQYFCRKVQRYLTAEEVGSHYCLNRQIRPRKRGAKHVGKGRTCSYLQILPGAASR